MAFPEYIPTRNVSIGGAMGQENSAPLRVKVVVRSSTSLVWQETGYRFERVGFEGTSAAGEEIIIELPRTDVATGWRNPVLNALIDASAPNSYTHRYTAEVSFLDAFGIPKGSATTIGPFTVPAGDGNLDLDKALPTTDVAGGVTLVPDSWSQYAPAAAASQLAAATSAGEASGHASAALGSAGDAADAAADALLYKNAAETAKTAAEAAMQIRRGTGSPLGVVTAPIGTEYIDTAATLGARKWYKATRTDNLGWIVVDGDTGWRSFGTDATYGVVALGNYFAKSDGSALTNIDLRIRRINDRVYLMANPSVQPRQDYSGTTRNLCGITNGWRSSNQAYCIQRYGNNGGDSSQRLIMLTVPADYANGVLPIGLVPMIDLNWNGFPFGTVWPKVFGGIWVSADWITNDPWPTVAFGTA